MARGQFEKQTFQIGIEQYGISVETITDGGHNLISLEEIKRGKFLKRTKKLRRQTLTH